MLRLLLKGEEGGEKDPVYTTASASRPPSSANPNLGVACCPLLLPIRVYRIPWCFGRANIQTGPRRPRPHRRLHHDLAAAVDSSFSDKAADRKPSREAPEAKP